MINTERMDVSFGMIGEKFGLPAKITNLSLRKSFSFCTPFILDVAPF